MQLIKKLWIFINLYLDIKINLIIIRSRIRKLAIAAMKEKEDMGITPNFLDSIDGRLAAYHHFLLSLYVIPTKIKKENWFNKYHREYVWNYIQQFSMERLDHWDNVGMYKELYPNRSSYFYEGISFGHCDIIDLFD